MAMALPHLCFQKAPYIKKRMKKVEGAKDKSLRTQMEKTEAEKAKTKERKEKER